MGLGETRHIANVVVGDCHLEMFLAQTPHVHVHVLVLVLVLVAVCVPVSDLGHDLLSFPSPVFARWSEIDHLPLVAVVAVVVVVVAVSVITSDTDDPRQWD